MNEPTTDLSTLGWREYVAFPDWGIKRVRAKIDTGARTSALHVGEMEELGDGRIRFEVVAREKPTHVGKWVEAEFVREANVKPSSGELQTRPVVRTTIRIGEIEREVEVSLVCRKGMRCRMLVGRTALSGVFAVDPARSYLAGDGRKNRAKKKENA
ncbi:MAG: RimK/LysX family protein [Phycisphaerales bacterium]